MKSKLAWWPVALSWVLIAAFLLYVVAVFSSCTTAKKATAYLDKHEDIAAPYCANKYPVRESVTIKDSLHTDTAYFEVPAYLFDTIYVEGQPTFIKQQCPPSKTITQTKFQSIERVRVDSARVKALEIRDAQWQEAAKKTVTALIEKDSEAKAIKESRNKWRLWCLLTWSLCAGYAVSKLRKRIPF